MNLPHHRYKLKACAPSEADIKSACEDALYRLYALRKVAWYARINGGARKTAGAHGKVNYLWFYTLHTFGKTMQHQGISDLVGQLTDGRFFAVEVKKAGEQPTLAQAEFLARVNEFGGVGFVARSVDEVFDRLKKE